MGGMIWAGDIEDVGSGAFARFKRLSSHPELLIRVLDVEEFGTASIQIMRKMFDELSEHSIRVPRFSVVLEETDEPRSAFVFTDWVNGVPLRQKCAEGGFHQAVDALYEGLVGYTASKICTGGLYVSDLHPDQFIVGATAQDPVERIYFIDLDPMFVSFRPELEEELQATWMAAGVADVADSILEVESLCRGSLGRARRRFDHMLEEMRRSALLAPFASLIAERMAGKQVIAGRRWLTRAYERIRSGEDLGSSPVLRS